LKEAESKSGNKKDENYIDKDRAIAVVIGNIKTFYLLRLCAIKDPGTVRIKIVVRYLQLNDQKPNLTQPRKC
jgi:hypothetical protein